METSNDYAETYKRIFKPFKKPKSKLLWCLYYGSEIIVKNVPYAVCRAKLIELRRNKLFQNKNLVIK